MIFLNKPKANSDNLMEQTIQNERGMYPENF
jgi:hypothetical protein